LNQQREIRKTSWRQRWEYPNQQIETLKAFFHQRLGWYEFAKLKFIPVSCLIF
jgi:hypothetical protein